ncbi:MAG: hypothetical protein EBV73_05695, partial [Rhodocyclales bacterium]|nr:hypothetical protein [Rhodocyclales bacterium]
MKKKFYSHLIRRKTAFYDPKECEMLGDGVRLQTCGNSLSALLAACQELGVLVLYLVCDKTSLSREWFFSGAMQPASYNHEYRSAQYEINGRTFHVKHAGMWFDLEPDATVQDVYLNWVKLAHWVGKRTKGQIPMMSTPSQVGLRWLETVLPSGQEFAAPCEPVEEMIVRNTPQARKEKFKMRTSELLAPGMEGLYYYDMRWAYAAAAETELPGDYQGCEEIPKGVLFESLDQFQQGWLECDFAAPQGWNKAGILPVKPREKGIGWLWPVRGVHSTICTFREARLAVANGWQVMVYRVWRFSTVRPLRLWSSKLQELRTLETAELYRGAVRNILLHSIGAMYARGYAREAGVSRETFAEQSENMTKAERLSAVKMGDEFRVRVRVEKEGKELAYYMPHWVSQLWAECRVRLTKELLRFRAEDLIACELDGYYAGRMCNSEDTGRVGQFREKGAMDGFTLRM